MTQERDDLHFISNNELRLSVLREQMQRPPCLPRVPLLIGRDVIGSVELSIATSLVKAGFFERGIFENQGHLLLEIDSASVLLGQMALWLNANGLAGKWRDEALAVTSEKGNMLASVERAVVRTLGIKSFAVRLVGVCEDGRIWLQRRALDKEIDPGKLDTLAGGLVAAGESLEVGLAREVWEEAGLSLDNISGLKTVSNVRKGGVLKVCCPIDTHIGGYMVEECHWFVADVAEGVIPENRDGEVLDFVRLTWAKLQQKMKLGCCADEATLIFAEMANELRSSGLQQTLNLR